jgi:hypothetical protein
VIDQAPETKIKRGAHYWQQPFSPETQAVQVHRWSDKVADAGSEYLTADYAIAERLWLRRGDFIGSPRIMIEVPTWQFNLQAWTVGHAAQAGKFRPQGGKQGEPTDAGVPVDLVSTPPTLLVDFAGGKKKYLDKRDGTKAAMEDSSSVEVLALTAEGRLVVRSSRTDADNDTPEGAERRERYDQWRERLAGLRHSAGAAAAQPPPGNVPPMGNKDGR